MTRQEIIDSLQTCTNAKCFDCNWDSKDYPVCMTDFIDGITPHIIHELQRIDDYISRFEKFRKHHMNTGMKYREYGLYEHARTEYRLAEVFGLFLKELKGDDTNANPSQP